MSFAGHEGRFISSCMKWSCGSISCRRQLLVKLAKIAAVRPPRGFLRTASSCGSGCTALMLLTAYPTMLWLVRAPSFSRLLEVELWLSFIYGSYNGAMVVFLTGIMPVDVRTTGFSLAYSLATAVFGGFTPAISTYLIHTTGNRAF